MITQNSMVEALAVVSERATLYLIITDFKHLVCVPELISLVNIFSMVAFKEDWKYITEGSPLFFVYIVDTCFPDK